MLQVSPNSFLSPSTVYVISVTKYVGNHIITQLFCTFGTIVRCVSKKNHWPTVKRCVKSLEVLSWFNGNIFRRLKLNVSRVLKYYQNDTLLYTNNASSLH